MQYRELMIKDVLENSVSLIHFQENALYMYDKIEKDTKIEKAQLTNEVPSCGSKQVNMIDL